ncbi:MAG: sugar phosphate isomerase/epimerase [Eubacteriales bacterium]|nr:sugar phosphate isomerase/epimerase [Eubacteriales bacterium]
MAELLLSAFADEISPQLDEQMDVLARHGIAYIEMRTVDGVNISDMSLEMAHQVKKRIDARGFRVSALGSPLGKADITLPFEPQLALLRHTAEVADVLECPYIRMFSFFIPAGHDADAYRDDVMRRLEQMVRIAESAGVTLLHENEKYIFGDIARRCQDIFATIQSPNFHMTYDPSNFVQCGQDNRAAWQLLREYVRYVHIKDSVYAAEKAGLDAGFDTHVLSDAHRPAGEGDGCVEFILRDLIERDYHGFVSVEPHLDNYALCTGSGADRFAVALYGYRRTLLAASK